MPCSCEPAVARRAVDNRGLCGRTGTGPRRTGDDEEQTSYLLHQWSSLCLVLYDDANRPPTPTFISVFMPPPRRRQHASRLLPTSSPSDTLSPTGIGTSNEKTQSVPQDTQSPPLLDDKAEAGRRSPNTSPAPQPPASTRSTFASIYIVAACTSAQLTSTGLGLVCAISLPHAHKDLHFQKENLQWIVNAYSISSVSDFEPTQAWAPVHRKENLPRPCA